MEYNSVRDKMIIPEYGRNIQKLVLHARTIDDLEYRQAYVEKIIDLIYLLNPQTKNVMDYKNKLWQQVFKIAEYDLDGVTIPNGGVPTRESEAPRPPTMPYPPMNKRLRHYGLYVQTLVQKAVEMEDGPVKVGFISNIGSFMKMAYQNWNSKHSVSDDMIRDDLRRLSSNKLDVPADLDIDLHSSTIKKSHRAMTIQKTNNNKNKGRNKNKNNRNKYRR